MAEASSRGNDGTGASGSAGGVAFVISADLDPDAVEDTKIVSPETVAVFPSDFVPTQAFPSNDEAEGRAPLFSGESSSSLPFTMVTESGGSEADKVRDGVADVLHASRRRNIHRGFDDDGPGDAAGALSHGPDLEEMVSSSVSLAPYEGPRSDRDMRRRICAAKPILGMLPRHAMGNGSYAENRLP
jgi:hypothetical protein